MKINFKHLIIASFSVCAISNFSVIAKEQIPETKEIIGSGIFDVNRTRTFVIDENTSIYYDEAEIDIEFFEIIGSGFKSSFTVNADRNKSTNSGTINAIELTTNIKGPVTSIHPLMILEQPVLATSDTVIAYSNELSLYQNLAVSGYLSANNSLKASRIMSNDSEWKIRGYATHINNNQFNIGTLQINRLNEQIIDCDSGFSNGALVEVKMVEDVNYQVGKAIDTILSIRCLTRNRLIEEKVILPSVIQGYISEVQGQDFLIDDIMVNVSNTTEYVNGEKSFIDASVNVEVEGVFDSQTSELHAEMIRFIDHRIEITFPVQPGDIVIGESVTIAGQTFDNTPQTKDNANILTSGIQQAIQIKVQGFEDSQGNAYINKTSNKGAVNYNNVSLRGHISSINNPEFNLLNNTVDASNSTIIKLGVGVIDVDSFFSEVSEGSQIDIKSAHYDTNIGKFTNGVITIRDANVNLNVNKEIIGSGIFGAFVTATISKTSEQIFVSSFE